MKSTLIERADQRAKDLRTIQGAARRATNHGRRVSQEGELSIEKYDIDLQPALGVGFRPAAKTAPCTGWNGPCNTGSANDVRAWKIP